MRRLKSELSRQYEAHLPMCRHVNTQNDAAAQSVDLSDSQAVPVLSGSLPQYAAVYTSGQQHYYSPLLLLSSVGTGHTVPSTAAVQFVTVATTSDAGCADGLDSNLTNGMKPESDKVTGLPNGDAVLDSGEKKDEVLNGVCKAGTIAAVDAPPDDSSSDVQSSSAVDAEDTVTSVPASPITEPSHNTRQRRRKLSSSLRRSSEPPLRSVKTSTLRHLSSDQPPSKKAAIEIDSLPLFLSSMTDDD